MPGSAGPVLTRLLDRLKNLPRDSRDTLFLLLVIAWVLLPQTPNLPVWCTGLAAGVLLWRSYLAFNNQPLPGRWWLLGLLAINLTFWGLSDASPLIGLGISLLWWGVTMRWG